MGFTEHFLGFGLLHMFLEHLDLVFLLSRSFFFWFGVMLTRFMKPERIRSFLATPDDIHFFPHIFLFRRQSISELFNSSILCCYVFGVFF